MGTSNAATGYVAKISIIRLNIGSSKLSSCMLSIGLGSKCEQGKGWQPMLSMRELSLLEPMLSLSMLILSTHPVAALDVTTGNPNQN